MSEGARNWLFSRDDELVWRRRLDYEAAERMRAARTAEREALVTTAIYAKQAALEYKNRCFWTSILMRHFERLDEKIDEETVRRVVYGFPGF